MVRDSENTKIMSENVEHSLRRPKHIGGPHNIGDPNDKSLRKVEIEVLIPQKIREKARNEKCTKEVEEFSKCCIDASYAMVLKCRKENSALYSCLTKWYQDEKLKEECTQEYLEERSEYRKSGIKRKPLKRAV